MIAMGFGMLCMVLSAEEFLMGWNITLANEYSELDAWVREWTHKLFICFETTIKSRRAIIRKGSNKWSGVTNEQSS